MMNHRRLSSPSSFSSYLSSLSFPCRRPHLYLYIFSFITVLPRRRRVVRMSPPAGNVATQVSRVYVKYYHKNMILNTSYRKDCMFIYMHTVIQLIPPFYLQRGQGIT